MKRAIASLVAFSVIAAPAVAATTTAAPAKVTKPVKKAKIASAKDSKVPVKKARSARKNG